MKYPRKPNRNEKEMIAAEGLDWKEWNVDAISTSWIIVIHKRSREKKVIWKSK